MAERIPEEDGVGGPIPSRGTHMKSAEHHLHTRRFAFKKLQEYPNPKKLIRVVDGVVFVVGLVGPLFSIPQVLTIWIDKTTQGVSLPTWISYFIFSCVWFVYGVVHKEKAIIISNGIFVIINFLVVLGIILF